MNCFHSNYRESTVGSIIFNFDTFKILIIIFRFIVHQFLIFIPMLNFSNPFSYCFVSSILLAYFVLFIFIFSVSTSFLEVASNCVEFFKLFPHSGDWLDKFSGFTINLFEVASIDFRIKFLHYWHVYFAFKFLLFYDS
jgi:hypothetical protein